MRTGAVGPLDAVDERLPLAQVGLAASSRRMRHTSSSRPSSWRTSGQLVDVAGVGGVDHGALRRTSHRLEILRLRSSRDRRLAAAHDDVGLDAAAAQLGDRVLGGLGLLLARRTDERHQRDVDVADVVAADVLAELPDGLEERQDLDVADGAADLGDHHVDVVGGEAADAPLDLVGDVGDDLHGACRGSRPGARRPARPGRSSRWWRWSARDRFSSMKRS